MVMTLRKRVPPPQPDPPSPSSSPERERERVSVSLPRKKKPRFSGKDNDTPPTTDSDDSDSGGREYENIREQRMRENKERMEKLGIFALSSLFNNNKNKKKNKKVVVKKQRSAPLYPRPPLSYHPGRRSHRLKNVQTAKFIESERALKEMGISVPDDWKDELYTEEDEKLLGNCETEWKLNVDGFGEDGDRLYDPVNGTSCHQCRQNTSRKHTYCYKCRLPQGQICGDCLYTRYGENVLETCENPFWGCPACRGICNCSRCRRAKGWPPVTILYPKVVESGFKSVAHYLILSRRTGPMTKDSAGINLIVDLTEEETQAPLRYEGSDTSAEWSESDSDDSDDEDSKPDKRNMAQSAEKHDAEPEVSNEAVVAEPEVTNEAVVAEPEVTNESYSC